MFCIILLTEAASPVDESINSSLIPKFYFLFLAAFLSASLAFSAKDFFLDDVVLVLAFNSSYLVSSSIKGYAE